MTAWPTSHDKLFAAVVHDLPLSVVVVAEATMLARGAPRGEAGSWRISEVSRPDVGVWTTTDASRAATKSLAVTFAMYWAPGSGFQSSRLLEASEGADIFQKAGSGGGGNLR